MNAPEPVLFRDDWPEPAGRFLRAEIPPPPPMPLTDILSAQWAEWVQSAAEAKAAPPDYVVAALLAVCGALVGNTHWASPWKGWAEPPVIWAVAIGSPSANKSPGLDSVLVPLRRAERAQREKAQATLADWRAKADLAKIVEGTWKEEVRVAVKGGQEPPKRPSAANPGPEPIMPRFAVSDTTVEKLAVIVASQPRGTLLARDELAGWLQGMSRYSGGGSDRPFWLEAYGGRSYSVERMGRDPVYIDRLSVGVLGGIQPDRLRSLLMKSDDDGLLARFLPVWPAPAPIKRPEDTHDDTFLDGALARLLSLDLVPDESGGKRPWLVPFADDARNLLDIFRRNVREWEVEAEGLLLSFIGKLPGLAVRLSLVLSMLDWASSEADKPDAITAWHFGRAAHFVESYLLPMARRAYSEASASKGERAARRLISLLRESELRSFTARDVLRMERTGLATSDDLNPGISALVEADIVREVPLPAQSKGGRPSRLYSVNPKIFRGPR